MEISNRREFFKKVFIYTSAGAMVQVLARNVAQADLLPIDMTGKKRKDEDNKACVVTATSIGYVDSLDKALKDKKITRQPGETCEKCMFYDFQKNGKPTCQLIQKCLVNPKGSCNSWVKKA